MWLFSTFSGPFWDFYYPLYWSMYKIWVLWLILIYRNPFWKIFFENILKGPFQPLCTLWFSIRLLAFRCISLGNTIQKLIKGNNGPKFVYFHSVYCIASQFKCLNLDLPKPQGIRKSKHDLALGPFGVIFLIPPTCTPIKVEMINFSCYYINLQRTFV